MVDKKKTAYALRVIAALKHADINQTEAAEGLSLKLGRKVPPQTIQYMASIAEGSELTADLAQLCHVRFEWLARGKGPMLDENAEPGPQVSQFVATPIVGNAMLGESGYFVEEDHPAGYGDGFIDHPTRDPNAYSLRVVGTSMEPAIKHGWFVTIEPNSPCVVDEYVHALTKKGQHMVKVLVAEREEEIILLSVNGGQRLVFKRNELEFVRYVGGIYPPSKKRL